MKKLFFFFLAVGMIFTACNNGDFGNDGGAILDPNNPLSNHKCASNEILYISKSCTPIELGNYDGWGANLVSNTYDNGVGKLKFDAKITVMSNGAFCYNRQIMYVKMPNTITSIGEGAFYDCISLASITIPNSVTSIGGNPFDGCENLSGFYGKYASTDNRCLIVDGVLNSFAPAGLIEYTIPNIVTTIGHCAFSNCSSLTSVTIPDSVTSIGDFAFQCCSSLTSVYCKAATPPTANMEEYYDWGAFNYNASGRKIYVPQQSVEAYKTAEGWIYYASYIEGYDF